MDVGSTPTISSFKRTLEKGPFLMPKFPGSSGVSEKERIGNREILSKIIDIYPKVSFWHFDGLPSINTVF